MAAVVVSVSRSTPSTVLLSFPVTPVVPEESTIEDNYSLLGCIIVSDPAILL